MDIVFYLLPVALFLAVSFLISFAIALRSGQFDDLDTPAYRILLEEKGDFNHEQQK